MVGRVGEVGKVSEVGMVGVVSESLLIQKKKKFLQSKPYIKIPLKIIYKKWQEQSKKLVKIHLNLKKHLVSK